MKVTKNGNILWTVFILVIVSATLTGCAGMKHTKIQMMPVEYKDVSVADGVKIAAQALQRMGFWITRQNDAAGYLLAEIKKRDIMGFPETFGLEVEIGKDAGGELNVRATSIAGREIAFTTDLPKIVKDFYQAFEQILAATYAGRPERKPAVTFEKRTKPAMPSTGVPEKETVPQPRPSSEPPTKQPAPEYEL